MLISEAIADAYQQLNLSHQAFPEFIGKEEERVDVLQFVRSTKNYFDLLRRYALVLIGELPSVPYPVYRTMEFVEKNIIFELSLVFIDFPVPKFILSEPPLNTGLLAGFLHTEVIIQREDP